MPREGELLASRRGIKRPGQARAGSGALAVDSGAKTRRYRKNGLSEEFTLQSFVTFYMAVAVELLEKLGLRASNPFVELLPSEARKAFAQRQRCSFSYMSDRTSLEWARHLEALPEHSGTEALRSAILAEYVFTRAECFVALVDASRGRQAQEIQELIGKHLKEHAEKEGRRVPLKTTISRSLQQGAVSKLAKWGAGAAVAKIANFVAHLDATAEASWARIEASTCPAASVLQEMLDLPWFRAHCAARLLWLAATGERGTSPDDRAVGAGAGDPLEALGEDFETVLDNVRSAISRADAAAEDGSKVVPLLERLGLFPMAAQTIEHLLCEAGKVFAVRGNAAKRQGARPGYKELFRAAHPMFLRAAGLEAFDWPEESLD